MTVTLGVIGASGFIGQRVVEMLAQDPNFTVVAIGRSVPKRVPEGAIARIADATKPASLTQALTGCQAAVYCLAGSPSFVRKNAPVVYQAAADAEVKRFIYLSSAVVHGQAPAPGTTEKSPLRDNYPIAYNNAKVRAEWRLQADRAQTKTELVIIRPGIVWGPKSTWIEAFANAVTDGVAYQADYGRGICNSVYVDNLVHGIALAAEAAKVDRAAFFIGDQEVVTWADLYRPIAAALGQSFDQLPNVEIAAFRPSVKEELKETLRGMRLVGTLLSGLQAQRKRASGQRPRPVLSPLNQELSALYRCQWHLPLTEAETRLGYRAPVSFEEGCRRTIEWLQQSNRESLGHH